MKKIIVAAVVVTAVAACSGGGHKAGATTGVVVDSTILINAGSHETFAPPSLGVHPALSAAAAWKAQQAQGSEQDAPHPIPASVQAFLGVLTSPPRLTDVLAWGYRTGPATCTYTGFVAPKPPHMCFQWDFVSARTGRMLEGTGQDVSLTHVTPTPIPTHKLTRAGFLNGTATAYAPKALEYQAPESVIGWTFDETRCRIEEHWFSPVFDNQSSSSPPCRWSHRFAVDKLASFSGHDGDYDVIAGHQAHRYREYVRATLANGSTALYGEESDAAWIFVVQRCGADPAGSAITRIDEVTAKGKHVIASLPVTAPAAKCP